MKLIEFFRANGYPHGLFQMTETGKRFEFNPVSQVRALNFTIERKNGTIGRVQANIDIRYSADGSTDAQTALFNAGQNMVSGCSAAVWLFFKLFKTYPLSQ